MLNWSAEAVYRYSNACQCSRGSLHRGRPLSHLTPSIVLFSIFTCVRGDLFVSVPAKLSVCVPLKSAITRWRPFVASISGVPPPDTAAGNWAPGVLSSLSSGFGDMLGSQWQQFYSSNWSQGMTHVLAVRDPLERLLSGYLEKCARTFLERRALKLKVDSHCINFWRQNVSFSDFVHKLRTEQRLSRGGRYIQHIDAHFRAQSSDCGSHNGFTHVLRWRTDPESPESSLHSQVMRLCNDLLRARPTAPISLTHCAASFPATWEVKGHATGSASLTSVYYDSPNVVKDALFLYHRDYAALKIPYPPWLAEMHPDIRQCLDRSAVASKCLQPSKS